MAMQGERLLSPSSAILTVILNGALEWFAFPKQQPLLLPHTLSANPSDTVAEGSLPSASHRSNRGFHCWVRNPVIPRRLLRVSPNQDARVRPARDF